MEKKQGDEVENFMLSYAEAHQLTSVPQKQ